MNQKIHVPEVDEFLEAVLTLQNKDEAYAFFEDICTVNELLAIAQRYAVAKMLRQKKTYLDISEATGASTATISRVNRSLNFGNDGYDLTFERLGIHPSQNEEV
jgi:TrpR-related protein YerC/YecD